MKKTQMRRVSLLLTIVMLFSSLSSMSATAAGTKPAGFTGDEISEVNLEVDSGYAWHAMTEAEANTYGLSGDNVYIAGNSGTTTKSVSNVAITVTESGALTFEYALSTYYDAVDDLSNNYFLGCRVGTQFTDAETTATYTKPVAQGTVLPNDNGVWASHTIAVDESQLVDGVATIYIAYRHARHSDYEEGENFAAIRNVTYTTGAASVIESYDSTMGSVTAELVTTNDDDTITYTSVELDEMVIGSTYRVTATANAGYQLCGWFRSYVYDGQPITAYQPAENGSITITVNDTTTYRPVFAEEGSYIARNGTQFYTAEDGLQKALDEAGKNTTVVLLQSYTLTEDITIPQYVTLYVPFRESWGSVESTGKYYLATKDTTICHTAIAGEDETYARLTVPSDISITVNGELVVGAVIGYPSQRYQGHVSGAHGRITNNGEIVINDGAELHALGIVDGSGQVYVNDGGMVREPMIVGDYAGGSNSYDLYGDNQMPFKRFAMQNVQCTLKMEAKSSLVAFGCVWALSCYNDLDVELFGDSDAAAFRPNTTKDDTVALIRTYDPTKTVSSTISGFDVTGICRTKWDFYGGMTFQPITISFGIQLSTVNADLTIPYNFDIHLHSGTYNFSSGLRLMPGAEVTVESDAIAKVGGRLMIMNGLVQTDMSGDRYPTKAELETAGFKSYATATLNGKLIMETGSALGGTLDSSGGGILVIQEGVYLINGTSDITKLDPSIATLVDQPQRSLDDYASVRSDYYYTGVDNWVQQDGAKGTYDENTVWFNLPAKLYNGTELIAPEAGKTYVSAAVDAATVTDRYEGLYVPDGEYNQKEGYTSQGTAGVRDMTDGSYDFTRTVNATWADGTASIEVTAVNNNTVAGYDNENSPAYGAKILVDSVAQADGTTKVTVTTDSTTTSAVFVHLVKYKLADGSEVILANEDGTYRDGTFVIPAVATSASVESGLLADTTGDGYIAVDDANMISLHLAKKITVENLAALAADVNGDNYVAVDDANSISLHLAKKVLIFPVG